MPTPKIPTAYLVISCSRCKHTGSLENWITTPSGKVLKPGHFQCPHCHQGFKRHAEGPWQHVHAPNGSVMSVPARIVMTPCKTEA